MQQREIFIPYPMGKPKWVGEHEVAQWTCWRDAVLWCWDARPNKSLKRNGDQATFRDFCKRHYALETHGSHVSRWFNEDTKAPMDMPVEFVAAFESFTGWHGLTQFFNRKAKTTCLEEMQHRLAA